ncbi:MAG: hypothetical protein K9M45_06825 [Kiritimatiellales bacterium]|nr:hypothetical protein [Kiritimatiellales bacterium]
MRTLIALVVLVSTTASAQSIGELRQHYNGKTEWESASGTFTFASTGKIDFKRDKERSGIWEVPPEVRNIFINADVRVTGQFTFRHDCSIEGADQKTSVIFGTKTPGLLHDKGLDQGGGCMPYSAVYGIGRITLHVNNLTVLNPIGFMLTGKRGAVMHLDGVHGIDDRGGWHNHSDGVAGANGSTVRNCYFEAGDDVIKVYNDMLIENTTIKMVQNTVPIQLGWGSYGDGAKGVFRNLKIIGDKGRGQPPAVIVGRSGKYRKKIEIHGLELENKNAALVSLYEKGMQLDLEINDADIRVKQFWGENKGSCRSSINGSTEQTNQYRKSRSTR